MTEKMIGVAHYEIDSDTETLTTGIHEGRVIVTVEAHGHGVQLMLPPVASAELARQIAEQTLLLDLEDDGDVAGHA